MIKDFENMIPIGNANRIMQTIAHTVIAKLD